MKGESRMSVKFNFDIDKAIAAATHITSQNIPEPTIGKVFKLLFLADKEHLVRYGRPIMGDRYSAMKDGPVPSKLYDLVKEAKVRPLTPSAKKLAAGFTIEKKSDEHAKMIARSPIDRTQLSKSDVAVLDDIVRRYGRMTFSQLRDLTHGAPAYTKVWKGDESTSIPMRFEDFFENDPNAVQGAKDEMLDNYALTKTFGKLSLV